MTHHSLASDNPDDPDALARLTRTSLGSRLGHPRPVDEDVSELGVAALQRLTYTKSAESFRGYAWGTLGILAHPLGRPPRS
jgi:hypothetical protein